MNPQGTAPVNSQYFSNLIAQINSLTVCGDVQAIANEITADLQVAKSQIEAKIAAMLPGQSLLTMSLGNIGDVISFLENFKTTVLAPLLGPYVTYVLQLEQLVSQIAAVISALEAAEARIASCSISIAPII